MENAEKKARISQIVQEAQGLLDQEIQSITEAIKAEAQKQIDRAQRQLQETAEDEGKLPPKDQRKKGKRDLWMVGVATAGGALLGLAVLPVIALSIPAITTAIAPVIGSGALMAGTALLSAAVGALLGNGVGQAQAYLTSFHPQMDAEQQEEISKQARQKVHTERLGKVICQLRLKRTRGEIGHEELAEACEALSDIARLQHGMAAEAVQELRQTASDARAIAEKEAAQAREEEKLEMEKAKAEKVEAREEKKDDLTVKKLEQDIDLEKKVVEARISRPDGEEMMQKFLSRSFGGDGSSLMPSMDMSKLMQIAIMQSMFGKESRGGSNRVFN